MAGDVDVQAGDVVFVRRSRPYFAVVQNVSPRRITVEPIDSTVQDRVIQPREIVTVYRPIGRPRATPQRLRPSPKQLRLDD